MPPALDEHPLVELSSLVDPRAARSPAAQQAIVSITATLRGLLRGEHWPLPFQIPGLAFCALAKDRALIADDQGLGKTTIALLRILLGDHFPALIVAPASVSRKWRREAGWWMPGVPVLMLEGERTALPSKWPGIVIVTWDLLPYHVDALTALGPRIVIGDEVQKANNAEAGRTGAFDTLATLAPHLLLLSGTPITNGAQELWRLLNLLDPRAWPELTAAAFKDLNKDDFQPGVQSVVTRRIRQFMLRRLKEQAMPGLKMKQVEILQVDLPPETLRQYKRIEERFAQWLRVKIGREVEAEGYDRDSDEWAEEVEDRLTAPLSAEALAKVNHLRKLVGRGKIPFAVRWIADMVRAGEPVVAFIHHKPVMLAVAAELRKAGITVGVYDGGLSARKREAMEGDFQGGAIDVILCSMAAEAGITLTRGRYVLLIERWWTARTEDQMVDRLHRIGQTRDVKVFKLCAKGTLDERFEVVTTKKRGISARTIDAGQAVRSTPRAPGVDARARVR